MSVEELVALAREAAIKADPYTAYATHFGIPRRTAKSHLFKVTYGNSGVTVEDYVRGAIRDDIAKKNLEGS